MVVCTFVADLVPDGKKGIAYGLYLIVADLTISRATLLLVVYGRLIVRQLHFTLALVLPT